MLVSLISTRTVSTWGATVLLCANNSELNDNKMIKASKATLESLLFTMDSPLVTFCVFITQKYKQNSQTFITHFFMLANNLSQFFIFY